MNIDKQDKQNNSFIDVNNIINEFVKKVSDVVLSKDNVKIKDLKDLVYYLQVLSQVDKTIEYSLFPETIDKINKTLSTITGANVVVDKRLQELKQPSSKNTKSNEPINLTVDEREKINNIINEKIQTTIKNINDVIFVLEENENKKSQDVKLSSDKAKKEVVNILTDMLSDGLKKFVEVDLGVVNSINKNDEEVLIDIDANNKTFNVITVNNNKTFKDVGVIDDSETQKFDKNKNDVNNSIYKQEKDIKSIGEFPDFIIKSDNNLKPDKNKVEKTNNIIDDIKNAEDKYLSYTNLDVNKNNKEIEQTPNVVSKTQKLISNIENEGFFDWIINLLLYGKRNNPIFYVNYKSNKTEQAIEEVDQTSKQISNLDYVDNRIEKETSNVNSETDKTDKDIKTISETQQKTIKDVQNISNVENEGNKIQNDLDITLIDVYKNIQEISETQNKDDKTNNNVGFVLNTINKPIISDYLDEDVSEEKTRASLIIVDDDIRRVFKNFIVNNEKFNPNATINDENSVFISPREKISNVAVVKNNTNKNEKKDVIIEEGSINIGPEVTVSVNNKEIKFESKKGSFKLDINKNIQEATSKKTSKEDYNWLKSAWQNLNTSVRNRNFFGVIGSVLDFFSIGKEEVSRYFYSTIRNINTNKNAATISFGGGGTLFGGGGTRGLNNLEKLRKIGVYDNIDSYGQAKYVKPSSDLNTYKTDLSSLLSRTDEFGNVGNYNVEHKKLTEYNLDEIIKKVDKLPEKDIFLQRENTKKGVPEKIDKVNIPNESNNANESGFSISYITEKQKTEKVSPKSPKSNDKKENENIKPKERTISILNKKCTGYLKVYPNRALDFSDTEKGVSYIIPFQFEPEIAGDSKTAEYNSISTIGRSQPVHVYRSSSARNINIKLKYLVVGYNNSNSKENNTLSLSMEGLNDWTEEYVYGYILKNIKSLVLPNITESLKWRLGPPIVQVWYGGIDTNTGSSTNAKPFGSYQEYSEKVLDEPHPMFITNWYTNSGLQSFRSIFVVNSVSISYEDGIINKKTKNRIGFTADLSLTEISPSVAANQIFKWFEPALKT